MRELSQFEKRFIDGIAKRLEPPRGGQLMRDMANATVVTEAPDSSLIEFNIVGYERPAYKGQHSFNVEARMLDADDSPLTVVLYADENDRLLELEFIRWDSGDLIGPRWETLEIFG